MTMFLLFFQDTVLWACLATMAAYAKDLNTAETAYAAIDEVGTKAFFNSLMPKISLVIIFTVCHTTLMMLVLRVWYWTR